MKRLLFFLVLGISIQLKSQNVGISVDGSTPDASAALDVDFSDKGFLLPRMTTAERDAISSPVVGLQIFNTTLSCLQIYISGSWINMACDCILPGSFTASAATGLTNTSLDANWAASTGATSYNLWVDDNSDFSSPVAGYGPKTGITGVTETVSSLTCGTTYYYRVQAVNSCGAGSNSNTITATPPCGPSCGGQVWAVANVNVGTRINGLPLGSNMTAPGGDEKYCYNDVEANCTTYGGIYEWGEAMHYNASTNCNPCGTGGVQGICPTDYHIPTDLEWSQYEWCVETTIAPTGSTPLATFQTNSGYRGTNSSAGPSDKMRATAGDSPAWDGVNTSGFGAAAGGYRWETDGLFKNLGTGAFLRSATESGASNAWDREIYSTNGALYRNANKKGSGLYVRCLHN